MTLAGADDPRLDPPLHVAGGGSAAGADIVQVMETVLTVGCTEACWTPVICAVCRRPFKPAGRSVPMEAADTYCDPYEPCDPNQEPDAARQHLWNQHDSNRSYTDPEGWAAHVSACSVCGTEDDEDDPEETYPLSAAQFAAGCGHNFHNVDICEDENGRWVYAYGARGKAVMARAVNAYDRDMTGLPFGGRPGGYTAADVEHRWAVCVQDPDGPEGWFIKWSSIGPDAPNAFQLTVVGR